MLSVKTQTSNFQESESESEVAQSCPTLCDPVDYSPPGSSLHGILQARILECVAISFSRGSSRPRNETRVFRILGRRFNLWATRDFNFFFQEAQVNYSFWGVHFGGKAEPHYFISTYNNPLSIAGLRITQCKFCNDCSFIKQACTDVLLWIRTVQGAKLAKTSEAILVTCWEGEHSHRQMLII